MDHRAKKKKHVFVEYPLDPRNAAHLWGGDRSPFTIPNLKNTFRLLDERSRILPFINPYNLMV